MSNQDIEGSVPAGESPGAPPAPAGTPEYLAQQLEKERDARAAMRERLRHTEALAAESHALRARMAQELERVTADRDRLRTAAANTAPATDGAEAPLPPVEPLMTPRAAEWPLHPPAPPARSGPWRALAMLGGLAAGIAALAWFTGTLPGGKAGEMAAASAPVAAPSAATRMAEPNRSATSAPALTLAIAPPAAMSAPTASGGPVALPPLTPEQQLAAAPAAAGPAAAAAPSGMAARLRTALDREHIAAPVELDAATGHVVVADPQADYAQRDRTELVIRAVYAGSNLAEPQIEHRWLAPMRGAQATAAAEPAPAPEPSASVSAAAAYAARHAAVERHKKGGDQTVADVEELRPVVPAGRVTASCMASLPAKGASRRAELTACMKRSCCSTANHGLEECRAYEKAYPFTCSAG